MTARQHRLTLFLCLSVLQVTGDHNGQVLVWRHLMDAAAAEGPVEAKEAEDNSNDGGGGSGGGQFLEESRPPSAAAAQVVSPSTAVMGICPVCQQPVAEERMLSHVDRCLEKRKSWFH